MCFSAQASFGAAVALAGVGAASMRSAPTRAHLPFAAIPMIFAAQQATEGALWLVLARSPYWKSSTSLSTLFLFFALLVWPSYLPFSLARIERDEARKRALHVSTFVGLALGGYLLACAALRPSYACVAFHHLYYAVQVDLSVKQNVPFAYLASVAAPLLISSVRGTKVLAVAAISAFLVAGALYRTGFASVWCFFAAILSVVAWIIVRFDGRLVAPSTARGRSR